MKADSNVAHRYIAVDAAMGEFFNTWDSFLYVVISVVVAWGVYLWSKGNSPRSPVNVNVPPGSKGIPIIGHTLRWYFSISSSHPPSFVEDSARRFGKIFTCNLFGKSTVISADAKFNRYILQNEGTLFKASYPKSFRDLVGKNGLIAIHGDLHRKLHGIAASQMTPEKLKRNFMTDIQIILQRTMGTWKDREMLFEDECRKLAVNSMANQLLGVSTEREINEMSTHFSDFVDGVLSIPINISGSAYFKAMKARRILICKISKAIEERKNNCNGVPKSGLLARILDEENLSEEIIGDFIISLLFAGHETTAKTMSFAVHFLTGCPKALEQLRVECDSLGRKRTDHQEILTWDDYKSMSFTRCVIDETLRLGGIAIALFRETTEDIKFNDYVIPKGWSVVPFLCAVHLNEEFYKDALSFNPWRWLETDAENKSWRNSELFVPFGGGGRFCPGAELARLQTSLFLYYFVTRYSWDQLKEDRPSYFPSARMVNRFPIHVKERRE